MGGEGRERMEMVTMTSGSRKLRSELGNALMESLSLRERRRRNVVEREREGGGRFL